MIIKIYPQNPNIGDIRKIGDILRKGGLIIYPTDTLYAFGCSMNHKKTVERMARLKGFSLNKAKFSLVCGSLSQLSEFTRPLDKDMFLLLKNCLPGPYTFVMPASGSVPRNYQNPNKTIGLRVPDNSICSAIVEELGEPLISTSVRLENQEQESEYLTDPELIHDLFSDKVDCVVDGGIGTDIPSTVADCSKDEIEIIRETYPLFDR
ncbi:MAG: threonylcarbamoyl-AMP synthase [Bacteroidales bacterium]|nr:threonylcarbamoyl-AMP synthase [Bacteroidales bacterium]